MNKKNNNKYKKKRENTQDHSSVTSRQGEDQREISPLLLHPSERSAIVFLRMAKLRAIRIRIYLRIIITRKSNQLWIIKNRYYRSPKAKAASNTQVLSLSRLAITKSIKDEKD